ncbi:MAG: EcsC family protein [Gammaproteobacteria bacterium]
MDPDDRAALVAAAQRLESMNLATRISQLVGMPIEKAMSALPGHWSTVVARITKAALEKALDAALFSMKPIPGRASNKVHKILAGVSGAVGGSFGITALAVELPISATIMLRSIADIARSAGKNLNDVETKMACLCVFALSGGGTGGRKSEAADTSYYAVRSFLTKALGDATNHIVAHGFAKEGAPPLVKLISAVASRFSVPVSEKMAAQTIPAIGLVGGATVNLLFIDHYQKMAKAHFTVRRLERIYGRQFIKQAYIEIVRANKQNGNGQRNKSMGKMSDEY